MQAKKTVQAEITELSFDPESLAREVAESSTKMMPNIRIILVDGGGDCKKYVSADGSEVLYVCGP